MKPKSRRFAVRQSENQRTNARNSNHSLVIFLLRYFYSYQLVSQQLFSGQNDSYFRLSSTSFEVKVENKKFACCKVLRCVRHLNLDAVSKMAESFSGFNGPKFLPLRICQSWHSIFSLCGHHKQKSLEYHQLPPVNNSLVIKSMDSFIL